MLKLLIAVDGSDHSRGAINAAVRLAQESVRLASELAVDMIVLGTRGMNPLGGLLLAK